MTRGRAADERGSISNSLIVLRTIPIGIGSLGSIVEASGTQRNSLQKGRVTWFSRLMALLS